MKAGIRNAVSLFKNAASGWSDDAAPSMGAALAFYTLFSMAPLLVLVIAIAGLVIGHDRAQDLLLTQLSGLLGDAGADGVKSVLSAASTQKDGLIATAVSVATLVLGATTVFAELQSDLNRIWHVSAQRRSGMWGMVRDRLLSFGMVVAIGFLLLVSLVVSAAIAYLGNFMGGSEIAMHAVELIASIAVMTGLFSLTFRVLPATHPAWRDVWTGALLTAVLFSIGKFAIGLYIGKSSIASSYGAAGTLVVAIVWVYYSAQIFFFGAEFTREWAARRRARGVPQAANAEFAHESDAMLARAHRILGGNDPMVTPPPRKQERHAG